MNILKRFSVCLLSFIMIFSCTAFAIDYNDVAENSEAIDLLSDLGIFNGYEDNTFKPNNTLTRAEAAAIMVRVLGLDGDVVKGNTIFTDVPAKHWASGYINIAVANGIINGMDDGTFNPDAEVTYGQIVKMIVCALGYEPVALANGGYLGGGYLYAGSSQVTGFTKGVTSTADAPASRATVAKLIYNALDIDLMGQNSFSTGLNGITYEVLEGKTILTEYLNLTEVDAVITDSYAILGNNNLSKGEIEIEVLTKDLEDLSGIYLVTKPEMALNLGYRITAYVGENDDDEPTVYAVSISDRNVKKAIAGDDIKEITEDEVVVYKNTSGTTSYELDEDLVVLVNGARVDYTLDKFDTDYIEELTLINNDKDKAYDVAVVVDYSDIEVELLVTDIDYDEYAIEGEDDSIILDFDDEDKIITIYRNGVAAEFKDIKENDVVTLFSSEDNDIVTIYVSSDTIEGTVEEYDSEEDVYVIDGVEYKLSGGTDTVIKLDEEGTFYLNAFGRIAFADTEESYSASNYVYILAKGTKTNFSKTTYQVKVMTSAGKIEEYTIKSKPSYNDTKSTAEDVYEALAEEDVVRIKVSNDSITSLWDNLLRCPQEDAEYKAKRNTLGKIDVFNSMVIFAIDEDEELDLEDRVTVTTVKQLLEDEELYSYTAYKSSSKDDYEILVVTGATSVIDKDNALMVVTKVTSVVVGSDKEVTKKITGIYNGEKVSVTVDPDEDFDISVGNVIQFATTNGYMTAVNVIAECNFDEFEEFEVTGDFGDVIYYTGYITEYKNGAVYVDGEKIYTDNCNIIVVDYTANTVIAEVGTTSKLKESSKYAKYVLVKTVEDEEDSASDIVVFVVDKAE